MRKKQKITGMVFAALCLLAGGSLCWGYVLCPEHILALMLKKSRPPSGLMVQQRVFMDNVSCDIIPGEIVDGPSTVEETVWYHSPGRFRSEVTARNDRRLYVAAEDRAVTIAGNKIVSTRANDLMAYHLPLAFQEWPELAAGLESAGVDMTISSLGRYNNNEISFVIGARYPDGSMPQLWVSRESYLPLRFIVGESAEASALLEIRYMDWQRQVGVWYPMRIEIYQGGIIQRVICADSRTNTTAFKKDFFNISALSAAFPTVDLEGTDDPERPDPADDVQKTIDDFRKLYQ